MSSVSRRIRRNINARTNANGHRSHHPWGGRMRGLNPVQAAHAEAQWKAEASKAKIASDARERMEDEHGRGVR